MVKTLLEAYNTAEYPVLGHGKRNVQVLKDTFDHLQGEIDSDIYGTGKVIEDFQAKIAAYLGKPSAVFFPSGTMAQQIALRQWCDEKGSRKVAYHPLCHLEIHEQDGLRELHHLEPVLLADKDRLITLQDVQSMDDDMACLLLELPQREIGGQLPAFEELEAIAAHCRAKGIKLHLDGARLYEILPYYGKTAAEVCALFDSVYVSFYKGIGGIAGAILAGEEAFASQSKIWKRRHGGDLISLYPYILNADQAFDERLSKMEQYYKAAVELAGMYNNGIEGVETRPVVPVSNMFHVHAALPKETFEKILIAVYEETGIGLTGSVRDTGEGASYYEVSLGDRYSFVPKDRLREAFVQLHEKVKQTLK
ncbi:aminotransferase class I/II-fold pyridoxal phosphate-dependent enzyme [Paenibacillus glycanilyticus]|uniref:threonine aldolase family protein n=1 Tax=Paenibacillus glycanilyticus TaxID=126569 RepID=UPI0020406768|nr:aminotransferase class I/II-fold pyridoxal phosphate-dependent enzyme [Paenibacillus glycanilyticus]MCM3625788.1 aminotransferase class I/II-fold pyridoxal phosphate-dependent enzyme [Paenibacillus glycanilyticus]